MRATRWQCGAFDTRLTGTLVMGIVNVTPDSFSDGGVHLEPGGAVAAGRAMVAAGAALVDVGGESTRPGADPVPHEVELARVLPVVRALAEEGVCVSVDTRHAEVARACVDAGASVINDVSGFRDSAMVEVAASCGAGLVVMHMRGEPASMQDAPEYVDAVAEVAEYLRAQAVALETAGVAPERIAVDPGIGFGKTTAHNLALLRGLEDLAAAGRPVVIGASRKRFIGELTGEAVADRRLAGSLAAAVCAAQRGAAVLRAHDVPETIAALRVADAIRGDDREGDS